MRTPISMGKKKSRKKVVRYLLEITNKNIVEQLHVSCYSLLLAAGAEMATAAG